MNENEFSITVIENFKWQMMYRAYLKQQSSNEDFDWIPGVSEVWDQTPMGHSMQQ